MKNTPWEEPAIQVGEELDYGYSRATSCEVGVNGDEQAGESFPNTQIECTSSYNLISLSKLCNFLKEMYV